MAINHDIAHASSHAARHPSRAAQPRLTFDADRRGDVYINGRFLSQKGSGVQRFARQLILALDRLLVEEAAQASGQPWRYRCWVILLPDGTEPLVGLQQIEQRNVGRIDGKRNGHLWDQMLRFHCSADDIMVNLANSGPVFRSRSISVLHDAAVFRTPANFTRKYAFFHQWLGRLLARRALIGTVSKFSRAELAATIGISADRIFVVPNSCEHLRDVVPATGVLARLGVEPQRYFLAIGSPVANKNLKAAVDAFVRLAAPGQKFVIVGSVDHAVFGGGLGAMPADVVLAGSIPDEEMTALLKEATALVFPSLYEGFGIPPLEAMLHGCPVIASAIPPVQEVCADAVLYFDPTDVLSITAAMRRTLEEGHLLPDLIRRGSARAEQYSWRASAANLKEVIDGIR